MSERVRPGGRLMLTGRCQVVEKTDTGYRVVLKEGWLFPDGTTQAEAPTSGELHEWVMQANLPIDPTKPIQRHVFNELSNWIVFARTVTPGGCLVDWYFRKLKGQFQVQSRMGWTPDEVDTKGAIIPVSLKDGEACLAKAKLLDREAPRTQEELSFAVCEERDESKSWPVDATWFNGELHDIKWTEERPFLRARLTLPLTGREKVRRSVIVQREDGPYLLFQCDPLTFDDVSDIFKGRVV